jgi:hypothetical protein
MGPIRTSSTNYENALREAHQQESASSELSTDTTVGSPLSATSSVPFPEPGQGVVPLHTGVGLEKTENRRRPRGMSLKALAGQQGWSDQDRKYVLQGALVAEGEGKEAGYGTGAEGKGVGHV